MFRVIFSAIGYASIIVHDGAGTHASIQGRSGEWIYYDHEFNHTPQVSLFVLGTEKVFVEEKIETVFQTGKKPVY